MSADVFRDGVAAGRGPKARRMVEGLGGRDMAVGGRRSWVGPAMGAQWLYLFTIVYGVQRLILARRAWAMGLSRVCPSVPSHRGQAASSVARPA